MHIPKQVIFGLGLVTAALVGWMLHASAAEPAPSMPPVAATSANPVSAQSPFANPASAPVYITIVSGDREDGMGSPTRSARRQMSTEPMRVQYVAAPLHGEIGTSSVQTRASDRVSASTSTDIHSPASVQGLSVIANGDHIVIANDGSIVSVGDNTVVRGNTGDAATSGSIAVDVNDSVLSTGYSHDSTEATRPPDWRYLLDDSNADGTRTSSASIPLAGSGVAVSQPSPGSRAIGIAGWANHSLDVSGSDNILTYDDSNVFLHRIGTLNGNTGDTDTSGVNVVDSVRSVVRSGDSGNSDETPDSPPLNPASVWPPEPGVPSTPLGGGAAVSVADINGVSTATGADSLVIGGDGVDDNGVTVHGDRNVATYDDGNVAIGGIGNVNAQIGDSDTSGVVVMAVYDSNIQSGGSFLPQSQQAGAQVGDPSDGDDPDASPAMT